MKFTEKAIRKLDDDEFLELFRVVSLEGWRRMVNSLECAREENKDEKETS